MNTRTQLVDGLPALIACGADQPSCIGLRAVGGDVVELLSTESPGERIRVTREELRAFVAAARAGELDPIVDGEAVRGELHVTDCATQLASV